MSWLFLLLAGLCEILWATGLKHLQDSCRPPELLGTAITIFLSVMMLAIAMKNIPMGTAYAIWTGIGALGTFLIGIIWFQEPFSVARLLSVMLIVGGLVGLKFSTDEGKEMLQDSTKPNCSLKIDRVDRNNNME
jgi:quaternary ammonium compound-resistance protein SugE